MSNESRAAWYGTYRSVITWLDNAEELTTAANAAARAAVEQDMGSGHSPAEYVRTVQSGSGMYELWQYGRVAGQRIADLLTERITAAMADDEPVRGLMIELLDVSNAALWAEIGEHYLPDADEFDIDEDDDEDGEDD